MKARLHLIALFLLAACDGNGMEQARMTYADKGKCGGTVEPWSSPQIGVPEHSLIRSQIRLTSNSEISWNGSRINEEVLAENLTESASMSITPWLELVVEEGAPCDLVNSVRSLATERGACVNRCEEISEKDWTERNPAPPESASSPAKAGAQAAH